MFDQLSTIICAKDQYGKYIYVNEYGAKLTGFSLKEVINSTDYDLIPKEFAKRYRASDYQVEKGLPYCNVIESLYTLRGIRKALMTKAPILSRNGTFKGIIISNVDITDFIVKPKPIKTFSDQDRYYLGDHFGNEYLTRRELEVLKKVISGYSVKHIAKELNISPRTVESHVQNLKMKLQCNTMGDIAVTAVKTGLNFIIFDDEFDTT
jgi:PAS domain S-box-containing protein